MYLGGSPFSLPGIFTILPYGELSRGLFFPRGGMYSIVRGIKSLLDELNINIRLNTPIKYISVKNSKVVGIELANGNILNFDLVVSNADVPTTYEKLLQIDERSKEKYLKQFNNKMTPGVFTFYLGIEGKVGNLPHHSIFLPNDYKKTFENLLTYGKLPNELPFYISIPSETDPSLAPESHSAVFILVPVPTISKLNITDYNKQSKEILSKVFERLRQHGIKIQKESIVLQKQLTPLDWQSKFYLYDGSAFGLSHTLFKMGPGRPKNFDTKIRGLYFVGGSTTPGTGVPMVLLSGKMTAERILSDV
jgi:phytoene desaturase